MIKNYNKFNYQILRIGNYERSYKNKFDVTFKYK